jgi:hypothetical protein
MDAGAVGVPNAESARRTVPSGHQVARSEHPLRHCFASAYIGVAEFLTMRHANHAVTSNDVR